MKRNPAIFITLGIGLLAALFVLEEAPTPVEGPFQEATRRSVDKRTMRVADQVTVGGLAVPHPKGLALTGGREAQGAELPAGFPGDAIEGGGFRMTLPDGREARGGVARIRHDDGKVASVEGRLELPEPGRYFFQLQTVPGVAGDLVGHILFDEREVGWKVEPSGPGGSPRLVETHRDGVICYNYAIPPVTAAGEAEEAPPTHPADIPIPSYQAVIPLQSLPGATGVIYLDFDGEQGPFTSWGDFDAAPSGASNSHIHEVWQMVAEDFQGFNLNITTDRKVYDNAARGRRQHVVITPTTTAAPGTAGIAYIGSFNWSDNAVCWAFYSTGKSAAETISHEIGHTLYLSHDGRMTPAESYYGGHGSGSTDWAPIMGTAYFRNLSQWSKGEYLSANQTQDDLAVIVSNNDIDYRTDDTGEDLETARYLEIAADNSVSNEGIIETGPDVDAFRFATSGGPVTLNVNPASPNPNLDILAELVDANTGSLITSANPDLEIYANISTTLPAGEYLLKVSGVGRGDPLGDGYTDYGSLGSYLISGSVSGGEKPDRFTISENSSANTTVGSVVPRNGHGASTLTWSIEAGNSGGAFTIHPATGQLTVVDSSVLDFESLSLRWDDPAVIELFVRIADSADPALDESIRVVVTVSDVNEPPNATGASLTLLERTRIGTPVLTINASDVDHFDFPTFSIASGNSNGWFAIDPATGEIRVNQTIEVSGSTPVALTVQVADQGTPQKSATAIVDLTVINIATGYEPGGVIRTYFEGIFGTSVNHLINATTKWPDNPDSEEFLDVFDGGEHGDNFGSTVRGFLIPPATGSYRFWISSGDSSQLRLSNSADPLSAVTIAYLASSTSRYGWPDSGSQMSGLVSLTAGQPYFIEARHKAGGGSDHVSVAWSGPGITKQLLAGLYLAPYRQNYAPEIVPASFSIAEEAFPGQVVGTVTATDINAEDTPGNFTITGGNIDGAFAIDPSTGRITVAAEVLNHASTPVVTLTVRASDDGMPALSTSASITIEVLPAGSFPDNGIFQQIWTGMSGTTLTALTGNSDYPFRPTNVRTLSSFQSGQNFGDNYGSRICALVTPPATGSYTFYLSSDDDSRLLLGTGQSPSTARQIASITGLSGYNVWNRYASQQSLPVTLVAGQSYYIETLQKEAGGGDHVQVAWTGPGIGSITVIPGSALRPFDINTPPVFANTPAAFTITEGSANGAVAGTVAATDPEGESPLHAIIEELVSGVFAIDIATGRITVADSSRMSRGVHYLTIAAQDSGIGGAYPLRTASKSVSITVLGQNHPPAFASSTISISATEDLALAGSLSAADPDGADMLSFTKLDGPAWLSVSSSGVLSGIPGNAQVGPNVFNVRVTDPEGAFDEAQLTITVANVNDAPVFSVETLTPLPAVEDQPYAASLSDLAHDIDQGDHFVFSKVSGPAWLTVAADGTLGGTPGDADVGTNVFSARVTDLAGDFSQTMLVIEVVNTNDPPQFSDASLSGPGASEDEIYFGSIASHAIDLDAGDFLVFSLSSGPSWLVVSPDGSLSGTPPEGSAGLNSFTVRATDPGGAYVEATLLIEVAAGGMSLPWDATEIGVTTAGSSRVQAGGIEVTGSGLLSGRNDSLQFVWQAIGSSGTITARIDAFDGDGPDSRAGVMVRDTLAANSRHVFMGMTGDGGYRWVRRTGFNGNTSTGTSGSGIRPDCWVRLVRSGNRITAFKSSDGAQWIEVGSLNAALPETCYFGLAVASGSMAGVATASFSNISASP